MNHTREAFIEYGVYLATPIRHDVPQRRTGQMSKNAFKPEPIGSVYDSLERQEFAEGDLR